MLDRGVKSPPGRENCGGRGFERLTDRRREQGDGPLSLDRRLAGRRGVSDSVGRDREGKSRRGGVRSGRLTAGLRRRGGSEARRDGVGEAELGERVRALMSRQRRQTPDGVVGANQGLVGAVGGLGY